MDYSLAIFRSGILVARWNETRTANEEKIVNKDSRITFQ